MKPGSRGARGCQTNSLLLRKLVRAGERTPHRIMKSNSYPSIRGNARRSPAIRDVVLRWCANNESRISCKSHCPIRVMNHRPGIQLQETKFRQLWFSSLCRGKMWFTFLLSHRLVPLPLQILSPFPTAQLTSTLSRECRLLHCNAEIGPSDLNFSKSSKSALLRAENEYLGSLVSSCLSD